MGDRIAVLRNGMLIRRSTPTDDRNADDITTLMIGQALKALARPAPVQNDRGQVPVMSVRDLRGGAAHGVSFDVMPGEIVGLYGLVGSGRSSVARTITGQSTAAGGTIKLNGEEVQLNPDGGACAKKIAYLTEDRRLEGFVKDFDNGQNMSLVVLPQAGQGRGRRPGRGEQAGPRADRGVPGQGRHQDLHPHPERRQPAEGVVAKWLETDPDFVVLDEPTKGIDVGARANIYEIIHAFAARGKGVLVVSSEAEELLPLCHRILVMRDGQIAGEFDPEHADHRRPHPHRAQPQRLTTPLMTAKELHPCPPATTATTARAVHHYEADTSTR